VDEKSVYGIYIKKILQEIFFFYFHHITEKFLSDFVNYTLRRAKLKNANSQVVFLIN
jgi:hypothetical protein